MGYKTRLSNRIVLVTGASSGIGRATAIEMASQGATVVLWARRAAMLELVAEQVRALGGRVFTRAVDLGQADLVQAAAQELIAEHGAPHILINSAGAGIWRYVDETSSAEAAEMIAAPYLSAFYATRAFLPHWLERNEGQVVNVTSAASFMVWPGATAYTAARWALRGFTEALAADLHRTRIRVSLATFAKIDSDYWQANPGSAERVPGAQRLIPVISPQRAAHAIVRGVLSGRRLIVEPFMLRVVLALRAFFPGITRQLMLVTGHRRGPDTAQVENRVQG